MAFVNAMLSPDQLKTGVNGETVYTEDGVGDSRVTLFTMLNRGLEKEYIQESIQNIMKEKKSNEPLLDLFLLAFHTRDVRGGKGERDLFYDMFIELYRQDPQTTKKMCWLIPEYGCWRDMWELLKREPELGYAIFPITRQQFMEDIVKASLGDHSNVSLLGKWLPREKSATYPKLADSISTVLYPNESSKKVRMTRYRKETSFLNRTLQTCEIDMCGQTWRKIVPSHIPGRSLAIHRKAFLNEKADDSENLRYPQSDDRMKCRENILAFLEDVKAGKAKAHGAHVVMPHEITMQLEDRFCSANEESLLQAQWNSIREETMRHGGLGKAVAMCDFSGSMSGLPLHISQALGILISEITHPAFRDHVLTFDSVPTWLSFTGCNTVQEKLHRMRHVGQGTSTNFYKACQLILRKMVDYAVPPEEAPEDLIVITDMGFDQAATGRVNHMLLDRIRSDFQTEGERLWGQGKGWKAPRIVIWNVRAEYKDFHATADQEGVVQLSGWSPSILKALQQNGVTTMTPYEGMCAALNDARYDKVRNMWKIGTDSSIVYSSSVLKA